uniref:ATP-grasp domain-containing protein n=1 Tax=Ditylenchus dipsaci TaxID=166011 RepID=A0A915CWH6_9BILA
MSRLLTLDTKLPLESISSKSKIVVLIKREKPFYTSLENLSKPKDCCLVGVFGEGIAKTLEPKLAQFFDFIFSYKVVEQTEELEDLKASPEVEAELKPKSLFDSCCTSKRRILYTRSHNSTSGPFRNKITQKQLIEQHNIPTAKFFVVDFSQNIDVNTTIEDICKKIPSFPMFRKPVYGAGSVNSAKIDTREDYTIGSLAKLKAIKQGFDLYLVEELLCGREFWASVILLPDGTIKPNILVHFSFHGIDSTLPLFTGQPILSVCRRFEDYSKEFPNMSEFVNKVVQALQPPHPNNFVVQGFQLKPETSQYVFTECAYRQGGPSSGMSYVVAGCQLRQPSSCLISMTTTRLNQKLILNLNLLVN